MGDNTRYGYVQITIRLLYDIVLPRNSLFFFDADCVDGSAAIADHRRLN